MASPRRNRARHACLRGCAKSRGKKILGRSARRPLVSKLKGHDKVGRPRHSCRPRRPLESADALLVQKRQRLQLRNLKRLAAAYIRARQFVVASYHVRLRLREPRPVPLIGPARQLLPLPPHHPRHLVLRRLPALRADQRMRPLLRRFVEKFPLFHNGHRPCEPGSSNSAQSIPYSSLP